MLEAFERHLKEHNVTKQFESAKTKEDKIKVCKKFLEDEGYIVKSKQDQARDQYKEGERYGMVANPFVSNKGGVIYSGDATGSIAVDSSVMAGKTLTASEPTISNPIKYLQARTRVTDLEMLLGDKQQIGSYVLDKLTEQIAEGVRQHIIDKNLIKSEYDFATTDKLFGVKIGIIG